MALYSDLVLKLRATVSDDGGSVLIEDVTGTYPESPGGYAPEGEGTLDRPSESEVAKFLMYRPVPFDPLTESIPTVADAPPFTYSLLDNEGNPPTGQVYQWVFMVTSIDGDTWDFLYNEAIDTADPWGFLVDYFSDPDSGNPVQIGQLAVVVAPNGINCVNDARRRLNNAWSGGKCDCSEYALKKALLQGAVSNAALAGGYSDPLSAEGEVRYDKSQEILDKLTEICADESCLCNC